MVTDPREGGTIGENAVPILCIFGIFFLNMLSRLGLGPLMPAIEAELGLRHVQAGSLFLPVSVGYGGGLFVSIFLSARISHNRLIFVSAVAVGAALLFISRIQGLFPLYFALFCLGLTSGLYLPSGVAMLTFLVRRRDWGKVLSIHQMAPNLAYICGPFAAALIADRLSWRFAMTAYGLVSLAAAVAFRTFGPAEGFCGAVPRIGLFKRLAETPAVWIMIVLFSLALGINQGLFSIIALYLTAERHLTMESANRLLAISRTVAFAMPLLTGWAADRYGLKRVLFLTVAASSLATPWIAFAPRAHLGAGLTLQAAAGVCFFPLGFAVLSGITPREHRGIAVAFTVPFGHLFGAGLTPTLLGYAGDAGSFAGGIAALGVLTFAGLFLLRFIRLPD